MIPTALSDTRGEAPRFLAIRQAVPFSIMVMCPVATQVRKFKAVNTGSLGVTFALDTKAMEKSGFTVTPDKMPPLAGAPVHASLELTVTLQVSMPAAMSLPV